MIYYCLRCGQTKVFAKKTSYDPHNNLDSSWNRAQKLPNRRWIPAKPRRLGRVSRSTSRTKSRVKNQDPVQTICSRLYWSVQARRLLYCWQVRHWHSWRRYSKDGWLLVDEVVASCCWKGTIDDKRARHSENNFRLVMDTNRLKNSSGTCSKNMAKRISKLISLLFSTLMFCS